MEASQFHTLINHYPMIFTGIGMIVMAIGLWRKNDRAMRVAYWIFVAVMLIGTAAFASGEIAGHQNDMLTGASGEAVRSHQQASRTAFLVIGCAGLASVFGLVTSYRRSPIAKWFAVTALLISIAGSVLVTRTTLLGRQIKYAGVSVAPNSK